MASIEMHHKSILSLKMETNPMPRPYLFYLLFPHFYFIIPVSCFTFLFHCLGCDYSVLCPQRHLQYPRDACSIYPTFSSLTSVCLKWMIENLTLKGIVHFYSFSYQLLTPWWIHGHSFCHIPANNLMTTSSGYGDTCKQNPRHLNQVKLSL